MFMVTKKQIDEWSALCDSALMKASQASAELSATVLVGHQYGDDVTEFAQAAKRAKTSAARLCTDIMTMWDSVKTVRVTPED
jgi:hypothetical protein